MKNNTKKYIIFAVFITISLGVGSLSSLFSAESMGGYASLIKPPLSPSNLVYFIVWALVYALMGLGAAIVCLTDNKHKNVALSFFVIQLILNFVWANVFFNLNAMLIAFVLIMILFSSVTAMLAHFYRVSKAAGVMQLPYLFWIAFLAYLNLSTYLLNR